MSVREKGLWGELLIDLVVALYYLPKAIQLVAQDDSVRLARELAGLAEQVGVTRQTLHAIEAAKYSPSLELAFRIAAVFSVPLDEIFQSKENC